MSLSKNLGKKRARRAQRVHYKMRQSGGLRVSIYRSLSQIYGQIIDDAAGKTLASCSSLELKDLSGNKTDVAKAVGVELAKRAQEKKISKIVFDRGKFLYHGRVKAFAEGLREGGLSF